MPRLLWNLSEGASGIVPYGSLDEITRSPMGSGPFKFVSAEQDKEIVVERNEHYWGTKARLARVRFTIVPDATTRALELRKGSADAAINAFTSDTAVALEREANLRVERAPGTVLSYLAFNLRDPTLQDVRVRQAIAYAVDRNPLLQYIWRGFAQTARSVLPPQSWAYDPDVAAYPHDPERARQIARCGRLSGARWGSFSPHDEDFYRGVHAAAGGGIAAAIARGGNRARHSHV